MISLKPFALYVVLPAVMALVALSFIGGEGSASNRLCKGPYALCTSALCVPQPGDPSRAVCFCDVREGPSLATVACEAVQPHTDEYGVRTVYSTYSLEQFGQGKRVMTCPGGTPWTNCLNKRCTVDPANDRRAICICNVMRNTSEWITLGGGCDTSTCSKGYWSGASKGDFDNGTAFLIKALSLKSSPVKWCEAR